MSRTSISFAPAAGAEADIGQTIWIVVADGNVAEWLGNRRTRQAAPFLRSAVRESSYRNQPGYLLFPTVSMDSSISDWLLMDVQTRGTATPGDPEKVIFWT
jgi:hypothetical protein